MAKRKTPARDPKTGKFLTKAQRAARHRGRGRAKPSSRGRGRAGASSAAAASASSARETEHQRRVRAGKKAARTRRRNEAGGRRPSAPRRGGGGHRRGVSRDMVLSEARAAARASARDILSNQRGKHPRHWRTGRYPAGHPRAGQFKSTRPGSGSVQDNPSPFLAAAENPMGMAEWLVGGFSLAVGAFGANMLDRTVATTALTDTNTKDAAGNEIYTDTGNAGSSSYAGMTNAAAVAAPMNIWRWVFGGVASVVPMASGAALQHFTQDGWPKTQAFLNFGGLGAFGNLIVKGGTDLAAYLLKGTAFGQRVFDIEIRAQALKAGSSYTGPTPPSSGLGAWAQVKTLGGQVPKKLAGCGGECSCGGTCDSCKEKKRRGEHQHHPPPAPAPGPRHHHHGNPPPPPKHVPPPCVPPQPPGATMAGVPANLPAPAVVQQHVSLGAPRMPLAAMNWGAQP